MDEKELWHWPLEFHFCDDQLPWKRVAGSNLAIRRVIHFSRKWRGNNRGRLTVCILTKVGVFFYFIRNKSKNVPFGNMLMGLTDFNCLKKNNIACYYLSLAIFALLKMAKLL